MERFESINEYKRGCEANYGEFVTTHERIFLAVAYQRKHGRPDTMEGIPVTALIHFLGLQERALPT